MLTMEEAWIQAAETTGLDEVDSGLGISFGTFLLVFEIVWWIAIAMFTKRKLLRSKPHSEINPSSISSLKAD